MTDPYANIRKALTSFDACGSHYWRDELARECDPDTIRALLAERDALARDAERLDWLASEAPPLWVSRDRGGYELPYFDITSGRECCDPGDLRAAIDQARGKENANG